MEVHLVKIYVAFQKDKSKCEKTVHGRKCTSPKSSIVNYLCINLLSANDCLKHGSVFAFRYSFFLLSFFQPFLWYKMQTVNIHEIKGSMDFCIGSWIPMFKDLEKAANLQGGSSLWISLFHILLYKWSQK